MPCLRYAGMLFDPIAPIRYRLVAQFAMTAFRFLSPTGSAGKSGRDTSAMI